LTSPPSSRGRRELLVVSTPEPEPLPPLYARWLEELSVRRPTRETRATCGDCAMCRPPHDQLVDGREWDRGLKCCTYTPNLPNYLVGAILSDETIHPHGVESIAGRLRDVQSASPLGLASTAVNRFQEQSIRDRHFGRAPILRCAHLTEGGDCSLWRHRNSVCSTWFCKHVRGAAGQSEWRQVRGFLEELETGLSLYLAIELGADPDACIETLLARDAPPGRQLSQAMEVIGGRSGARFGSWRDSPEAYYRECGRRAMAMDGHAAVAAAGPKARAQLKRMQAHLEGGDDAAVPDRLIAADLAVRAFAPDGVWIATYSKYDPILITHEEFDALRLFDGHRPTSDAVETLRSHGFRDPVAFVVRMIDFRVVRAASAKP
jgi:hypothetical protein